MSDLHNALLRGPWSAAVQNALGVGGSGEGGVERYGETLTPVIDIWMLPEWRYLRRERTGILRVTEGVGAGRSRVGIQNGSATDLVIVEWIANQNALASVALTLGTGLTVDTLEIPKTIDTRFDPPGTLAARATRRQGAIGGVSTAIAALAAPQGQLIPVNIVLGPGWMLSCDPSADATAVSVVFQVRERAAQRGEL